MKNHLANITRHNFCHKGGELHTRGNEPHKTMNFFYINKQHITDRNASGPETHPMGRQCRELERSTTVWNSVASSRVGNTGFPWEPFPWNTFQGPQETELTHKILPFYNQTSISEKFKSVKIKTVEFKFKLSTCNNMTRIMTIAGSAKCMTSRYYHEGEKKKKQNPTNKTQSL